MKKFTSLTTLSLLSLLFCSSICYAQKITTHVKITGLRSTQGKVVVAIFTDNISFANETPLKSFVFDKKSLVNGTMTVAVNLASGTYGLSLMDDENANGKMEKNLIGIPKEGFGFSNYFLEKLKKPVYDDFKVNLKTDHGKVGIRVKYL